MRTRDPLFLAGRVLLGGFLLQNAWNHFSNTKQMTQYAGAKEVRNPKRAVLAAGGLLALGGASILTGYRPKLGAAAAAAFFISATPKMHAFWKIEDDQERAGEFINFSKNLALLGAALSLTAVPEPWPLGIRTGRRPERPPEIEESEIPVV